MGGLFCFLSTATGNQQLTPLNWKTLMNNTTPWTITTAIPYVNARPHLGFALEIVLTDALARFQRLRGRDVWFLTGTDENSLKNVQAAAEEGIPTQALVDRNAAAFYDLREALNLSFDDFIRTSVDPRHLAGATRLWRACAARGDIYKQTYGGLYCVGCETFYTEKELWQGLCPEHLTAPEWVEEENYFFRLSRYEETLLALIESGQLRIEPNRRQNEVLNFIRQGLRDFSISRSVNRARGWGIPVPDDPTQVMYVWFDALGNYITALDYATESAHYRRRWLECPDRIHVIGKGIIRFHAVYWPAMLLSAGVPLPTTIFVHGYVNVDGQKIGKSLGNAIDPVALVNEYGVDSVRYYLLREIRAVDDGDFTLARFIQAHNGDLADRLGNLLNRVMRMIGRYEHGVIPAPDPAVRGEADARLIMTARQMPALIESAMSQFLPHDALGAIWGLVAAGNRYVDEMAPWVLAGRRRAGDAEAAALLSTTLYNLAEALRLIAYLCQPFLPHTAAAIAAQLNVSLEGAWAEATAWGGLPPGRSVQPGPVLFPKLPEA